MSCHDSELNHDIVAGLMCFDWARDVPRRALNTISSGLGLSNAKAEGGIRLETMTSLFLACEAGPDPDPLFPFCL